MNLVGTLKSRAECSGTEFVRGGVKVLVAARFARHASEALAEVSAIEEGIHHLIDKATPASVSGPIPLFPCPSYLVVATVDEAVQGGRLGTARTVDFRTRDGQDGTTSCSPETVTRAVSTLQLRLAQRRKPPCSGLGTRCEDAAVAP